MPTAIKTNRNLTTLFVRFTMNYYIGINSTNKAKQDIDTLMKGMGFHDIAVKGVPRNPDTRGGQKVETFTRKLFSMISLLFLLKKGDVLLIQYPFKKFYTLQCRIAHLKGTKVVTLIHDLGTFRRRKLTAEQEMKRLSHTDHIIAHNPKMQAWIEDKFAQFGYTTLPNVSTLGIFDYLSDAPLLLPARKNADPVVYAGGLSERKNSFLYDADKALASRVMDLYGSGNLDTNRLGSNIHYHGHIDSNDFIRSIGGSWGLVWDGDSCNGCGGIWGEYLKLNNPHKTSFYLRAGLPVIVWRQSAMADFITTNKVGIAIDNLSDIPTVLAGIDSAEYGEILERVAAMQQQLNKGHYFKHAFADALKHLEHKD